jgi:hypothetical protein
MFIKWEGKEYEFDPRSDLTVQRLRVLKQTFGPEYGKFVTLMQNAADGDADAMVAVMWVMKTKAGESCDPRTVPDFALGEFMEAFGEAATAEADARTEDDGVDPTSRSGAGSQGSTPTQTT